MNEAKENKWCSVGTLLATSDNVYLGVIYKIKGYQVCIYWNRQYGVKKYVLAFLYNRLRDKTWRVVELAT
jgi:hypothetical protein